MTMELVPAPRLSVNATPIVLPPDGPSIEEAERQFRNGAVGDRDLLERELLGHAMGSDVGLVELRKLDPQEFSNPVNQNVAQVILDLDAQGLPHGAAAVTDELRRRPLFGGPEGGASQLPPHLNPDVVRRHIDPATYGLGAWERSRLASPTNAPQAAQEIRAHTRQDRALTAARSAVHQYAKALEHGRTGRVVTDGVGDATLDLAQKMVDIPKALVFDTPKPSTDLAMPKAPQLSMAGQRVLHG